MQVHGSCHCGQVRYEATADPARTASCHCTDCQALTGSAYRVTVAADEGSFRLVAGTPKVYVKVGDRGTRRAQAFCADCGSPLYTFAADHPTIYGLRIGCIAERRAFAPRLQKYCRSALDWTESLASIEKRDTE